MQEDFFKIIGILIVSFFIIYIVVKMFYLQTSVIEGLTTASDTSSPDNSTISSKTVLAAPSTGIAGTAASYAAAIKAQLVKLQDELLISKYRSDYETAIINLDDYIGCLMIKQTLSMNPNGDIKMNLEAINNLKTLMDGKLALNQTMAILDKQ